MAQGRGLADSCCSGPPGVLLPADETRALDLPGLVRLCPAGPRHDPRAADGRAARAEGRQVAALHGGGALGVAPLPRRLHDGRFHEGLRTLGDRCEARGGSRSLPLSGASSLQPSGEVRGARARRLQGLHGDRRRWRGLVGRATRAEPCPRA
eukprot:3586688-Pyramimonas_sp.AAC.1